MLSRLIQHRRYLPYCFEALFYLAISKFWVLFRSSNIYVAKLGVAQCETLKSDTRAHYSQLMAIRLALRVVSAHVPWRSVCLDQAIAAQRMLSRRGLQSTFYFGVARGEDASILAHAWVRSGQQWIVGYQSAMKYHIVNSYAQFENFDKLKA